MEKENKIVLLGDKTIRKVWHNEEWFFSVIDLVAALTESVAPQKYWYILKKREPELSTICRQLKLVSIDKKERLTDVANTEGILRIVMCIPSPKHEQVQILLFQISEKKEINLYELLSTHIKQMIVDSQIGIINIRNRQFLKLYWNIGHCILALQKEAGQDNDIISQLFKDLKSTFSQIKGLTEHNLKYMTKFALENPKLEFVQELLA